MVPVRTYKHAKTKHTPSTADPAWIFDAFREGKPEGFNFYYDYFKRLLFYFSKKLVGNEQEAEEVVADSFVKLERNRAKFEKAGDLQPFLLAVARNACYDILRSRSRETVNRKEFSSVLQEKEGDAPSPEHLFILAEMIQAVHAEIENLPERAREIFKLVYLEGKTTEEIAIHMQIDKKTVLNQKERARKLLKAALLKKNLSVAALALPCLISTIYTG
jgi:RNA polymerase sigma factor (sigma-70 family)